MFLLKIELNEEKVVQSTFSVAAEGKHLLPLSIEVQSKRYLKQGISTGRPMVVVQMGTTQ